MSCSRLVLALARALLLAFLTVQCVAGTPVPTGAGGPARTYQGLTLEEWREIPYRGKGRLNEGSGNITFERDVTRAIEALREFARESVVALEHLRRLGRDLDEDVREEADAALVELAHSEAPNQALAWDALMDLVAEEDPLISCAAVGQLVGELEDEDTDWARLGPAREEDLAARVELLLLAQGREEFGTAIAAVAALSAHSGAHERRFTAALVRAQAQLRAADAADELNSLAWDFVDPELAEPRCPTLALEAARIAVTLAPDDPHGLDTLALAHWRHGNRDEALTAARRAVEASARLQPEQRERIEETLEYLGRATSWTAPPPVAPR